MWLFDYIKAEAATVVKAPFLFVAALALGAVLGWGAASTFYEQDLQTLRDQLAPYLLEPKTPLEAASFAASTPTPNVLEMQAGNAEEAANAEIAKLKAENARLKTRPIRTSVERPAPSACPSVASVLFPSRIDATDCDALTGAQRSLDIADEQRRNFIKGIPNIKGDQQALNAASQEAIVVANFQQAFSNLTTVQSRLCANSGGRYTIPHVH